MHRQSHEEVAAAARRRLELLGRELEQAGLRRVDDDESESPGPGDLPEPEVVAPVGRHARASRPGAAQAAAAWVRQQVPDTLRGRTELGSGPVLLVVTLVALALAGTVFVVLRMHADSQPVPARTAAVTPGESLWCRAPLPPHREPRPVGA